MRQQFVNSVARSRLAVGVIGAALFLSTSARATDVELERFKAQIDALIERLGPASNGLVTWVGSDAFDVRQEREALIAVIAKARLSLNTQQAGQLVLDQIEIRKIARKEGDLIELDLALPKQMTFQGTDGPQTRITLDAARATVMVETESKRARETAVEVASGRIDQSDTGTSVSLGPLSIASKLSAEPHGGWSGPLEFEVKNVEYSLPLALLSGRIDRIAIASSSVGPNLNALDKLRYAIDGLKVHDNRSPQVRNAAFLATLTTISQPFSTLREEIALEGLNVRGMNGETLVAVATAGSTIEVSGLDGDEATLRFSIRHEGLDLASSLIENWKVPHQAILDIGFTELNTGALRKLLQALSAAPEKQVSGNSEGTKQDAIEQALGAAEMLNPTFHIYEVAFDTPAFGARLTGEAKGSPLAPTGYAASGDLAVRGFDTIANLSDGTALAGYFPVLREISVEPTASDGAPQLRFHLSSAPPGWFTINGNDVSAWFGEVEAVADQPRLLKPSDPPMQGDDVRSVQRALLAAKIIVEEDGVYNSATAGAVARFQKEKGINVSGVADAMTRQRLSGVEDPPRRPSRN